MRAQMQHVALSSFLNMTAAFQCVPRNLFTSHTCRAAYNNGFRRTFTLTASTSHSRIPRVPTIPSTKIKIFREIDALRKWRKQQLLDHRTLSLVPTMGALHTGHTSLIRLAASQTSSVIISIYVNPTQFGLHEDLDSYPKTWDADCAILRDLDRELAEDGGMGNIAAVFAPTTDVMYPAGPPSQAVDGKGSFVTITPVGELLEGKSRPTFFRGVATVCMKLFNIVMPDKVYFGQKDVQQTVVIRKMVADFCMGTEVVVGETVRENDGLALSSRNVYLGERRRAKATILREVLQEAEKNYTNGARKREDILESATVLAQSSLDEQMSLSSNERVLFEVDYISLADPTTMREIDHVDDKNGAILSGAIKMLPVEDARDGEELGLSAGPAVRLIDNIILKPKGA